MQQEGFVQGFGETEGGLMSASRRQGHDSHVSAIVGVYSEDD